ncbi:ABC transporter permease [Chloroflexi bacterium TSY]|nr:ABC transporter permease [Chloroflexi bacterium TSY]
MAQEATPGERLFAQTGSATKTDQRHSPYRRALYGFLRHRMALFSLAVITLLVLLAISAPIIAPYDPTQAHFDAVRAAPNVEFFLGTDDLGRDILSRMIYAARISVSVGIVAVGIYQAIALVLGALSGYFGGIVDMIIQRLVDIAMSFPTLIIILVFIALLGPSIFNVMIAIGLLSWPGPTRLYRAQILQLRAMDYVLAARSTGVSNARIIVRHILPGIVSPLVVNATFGVGAAIMAEAGLSFLGLGVQPPTASWGNMLSDAQNLTKLQLMPWLWVPPGLAIAVTVLAINFIGDGLRDALDPKQIQ